MDLIDTARLLGKALQENEHYLEMQMAQQQCDEDETLQDLMLAFDQKRNEINAEAEKDDRDEEALRGLNVELRRLYGEIMGRDTMRRYTDAKGRFDAVFQRVSGILTLCAQGADPETCDYEPADCAGNCAGCAGCH